MDKLTLYTSPSAFPNPQRVRLLMHEKGIAQHVEERVLDMAPGGEQRGWQHLKRNPWGETPTLELPGGGYLAESVAIARYLDESFPAASSVTKNHARSRPRAQQASTSEPRGGGR